jgi:hypothetical protein
LETYIASRWDVSIKSTGIGRDNNRDADGWYDDRAVYLPTSKIVTAAGGNLKQEDIARILDNAGLLIEREDEKRLAVKYVRGIGKVRCYALSRREFGRDTETRARAI